MAMSGAVLAGPLSRIFVGYDLQLFELTRRGLSVYSLAFLLMGFNIFGSAFFTALNDGVVSAGISFLRTLLFQVAAVLLLPLIWELDGIWFSIVAAEGAALVITGVLFVKMRSKYHY